MLSGAAGDFGQAAGCILTISAIIATNRQKGHLVVHCMQGIYKRHCSTTNSAALHWVVNAVISSCSPPLRECGSVRL
jgi:hypothetical protein